MIGRQSLFHQTGLDPISEAEILDARRASEASLNEDEAAQVAQAHSVASCAFDIQLYCTRRESYVSLTDPKSPDYVKMFVQSGRCDVKQAFETFGRGPNTLAAVCGPQPLMQDVSAQAFKYGTAFHAEEFFF